MREPLRQPMPARSTAPAPAPAASPPARERIDRALLRDTVDCLRSPAVLAFLAIIAISTAVQVVRGGIERLPLIATIGLGFVAFAILAWFAGRHDSAVSRPHPVRWPVAEGIAILPAYAGLVLWLNGRGEIGGPIFLADIAGWVAAAVLARYRTQDFGWLLYSVIPFVPMFLAIALPKLFTQGPAAFAAGALLALPSGVIQQVLLQEGLIARLEALGARTDVAAIIGALAFGVAHAPMNLQQAQGDHVLALTGSLVYQALIGLVFIIGYLRHRAAVPLGIIHGIAIA